MVLTSCIITNTLCPLSVDDYFLHAVQNPPQRLKVLFNIFILSNNLSFHPLKNTLFHRHSRYSRLEEVYLIPSRIKTNFKTDKINLFHGSKSKQ